MKIFLGWDFQATADLEELDKERKEDFKKYEMEVVGFWTVRKPEDKYALVYLMRYSDEAAMEKAWAAFRADAEWIETRERTEANGPIVEEVLSEHLIPTSFSPMQ